MTLRFGTDGIRGVANRDLTPELVTALGRAAARVLGIDVPFVVGRDTRRSGPLLQSAFVAGLCGEGADVELAGVLPTPGVADLARARNAAGGGDLGEPQPVPGQRRQALRARGPQDRRRARASRRARAPQPRDEHPRRRSRRRRGRCGSPDQGSARRVRRPRRRCARRSRPRQASRSCSTAATAPRSDRHRASSSSSAPRSRSSTRRPTAPTSTAGAGPPTRASSRRPSSGRVRGPGSRSTATAIASSRSTSAAASSTVIRSWRCAPST